MRTISEIYEEVNGLDPSDYTLNSYRRKKEILAEMERDHGPHAATVFKLFLNAEQEEGSEHSVTFSQIEDVLNNLSDQFRSL